MAPANSNEYEASALPNYLSSYYKHFFPFGPYYEWLSYSQNSEGLGKREFSFTLQDDIYIRYQSYNTQAELETDIQKRKPHKIDIGAIYNIAPKDHKRHPSGKVKALTKELVFDIDMTDYDEVRTCCQDASICPKCWTLMKIAIKIMHRSLKDDFGFRNILWIYSGKRGVHCWVADASARKLQSNARSAIVDYLSLFKPGRLDKKVYLRKPVHPFKRMCVEEIGKYWDEYALKDQDLFMHEKTNAYLLKLITGPALKEKVIAITKDLNAKTSVQRWDMIEKVCKKQYVENKYANKKIQFLKSEIMLEFCLPRLDAAVTRGVNHLLKSPFSVHPKTGRVCVPIDPDHADEFDPFTVPTISGLMMEMKEIKKGPENPEDGEKNFYKRTSLAKYTRIFEEFVAKLKIDEAKLSIKEKAAKSSPMEF